MNKSHAYIGSVCQHCHGQSMDHLIHGPTFCMGEHPSLEIDFYVDGSEQAFIAECALEDCSRRTVITRDFTLEAQGWDHSRSFVLCPACADRIGFIKDVIDANDNLDV